MKHILSFSGGKDSTFLLLELIRRNYPLDEVQFFDTGWEFPAMYAHIDRCKKICEDHGIKFTTLHPKKSFDYYMFEHPTKSGKKGYSWCGRMCRWGTTCKRQELNKNAKINKGHIIYIGIAADEPERIAKNSDEFKRLPLVEWGITEAECLQGCYNAGFDWGGMYEHLDRLSCKFCRNKNLKELRNIREHYPEVWAELKEYQERTRNPYKLADTTYPNGLTVQDLEKRFDLEAERVAQGLSITSRDFHRELKKVLGIQPEEERRQITFFD